MNEVNFKIQKPASLSAGVKLGGVFHIECIGPDGKLKWEDTAENLVTTGGMQHLLEGLFNSDDSANVAVDPWYIRLTAATPTPADGDTLATHAGWTEFTDYSEAAGQAYVGVLSTLTMTNTASKAAFSINQDASSVGGAYMASVATTTTGTLLCVAAFTGGNKAVDDGDTLNVTYTFTAADDAA